MPRYVPGDDQSDSPHSTWRAEWTLAKFLAEAAERRGEAPPPPFDEPEPQPIGPPAPCPTCGGRGALTKAEIDEADAEDDRATEWLTAKAAQMAATLATQRVVEQQPRRLATVRQSSQLHESAGRCGGRWCYAEAFSPGTRACVIGKR